MLTNSKFKIIITGLIGIILLISCHAKEKPLTPVKLSPERKAEVIQSVVTWLECEECDEGELDRLKREGDSAIPTLAAALNDGPSPASIELMRLQMEKRYDRLMKYAKTHPKAHIQESKKDFVFHYLNNYEALYRIRAVQGLSAIGGENAYKAIQNASRKSYREDVNVVIKEALKAEKK